MSPSPILKRAVASFLLFTLTSVFVVCLLTIGLVDHTVSTMDHGQSSNLTIHLEHASVLGSTALLSSNSLVALAALLLVFSALVLTLHIRITHPRIRISKQEWHSVLDTLYARDRERRWFTHRFVRSPSLLSPA
mgnify:FL=1